MSCIHFSKQKSLFLNLVFRGSVLAKIDIDGFLFLMNTVEKP